MMTLFRPSIFRIIAVSAALASGFMDSHAAYAAQSYKADYAVYSGGLHVVNAAMTLKQDKDIYDAHLVAGTQGFLRKLAPWDGTFTTKGWVKKASALQPEKHESVATWRGEVETKTYSYGRDGSFKGLKVIEEGKDRTPKDLDLSMAQGSTDLLSATWLTMAQVKADNGCASQSTVFDGERTFTIAFRKLGTETLTATKYNNFAGEAEKCEIEITPLKGRWHKKPRGWLSIQEQGRQKGKLPIVWFAKLDNAPVAVPVKLQVTSAYGTLFMHMVSAPDKSANEGKSVKE